SRPVRRCLNGRIPTPLAGLLMQAARSNLCDGIGLITSPMSSNYLPHSCQPQPKVVGDLLTLYLTRKTHCPFPSPRSKDSMTNSPTFARSQTFLNSTGLSVVRTRGH